MLVGASVGLSFLLGLGALAGVIAWTTAIEGVSALTAAGGIAAFLGGR